MRTIRVKWSNEDLKAEMMALGYEPTVKNIKTVKENRLIRNVEDAMTSAGWEAIRETILLSLGE